MDEIRLNVYIHAPVERVFDVVADHESFLRNGSGIDTKVVRPGSPERNGRALAGSAGAGVFESGALRSNG